MDSGAAMVAHKRKSAKDLASRQAGLAEKRAKWPAEVRDMKKGVMEGYRQMVLPRRRFRYSWRSLKGVGFWVTAKDLPVYFGKTLREATLKMVRNLPEYAECTVLD